VDRQFPNERKVEKEIDRWYADYSHVYEMPGDLTHRVKLTNVSDLRYPIDFPRQLDNATDPALANSMSLTKTTDTQFASIEGTYNINLLKEDPLASNTDAVHRLPEIHYNITNQRIFNSPILAKLDMSYVNFTRSGLSYDNIEADGGDYKRSDGRDGSFDPNPGQGNPSQWDLIRTGHRFDAAPSFSAPFQVGKFVDVLPKVTYRETHYRFQIDDDVQSLENYSRSANRRYLQTDLTAKMQFSKVFGDLENPKSKRLKHEIEPEISISQIPWIKRPEHGFFGDFTDQAFSQSLEPISDEDVFGQNRLQFDYNDRVFDRSLVTYAFTSKLTRKTWKYGQPDYTTVMLARINQSYDINEANDRDKPEPWLPMNALLKMQFENFETFTQAQYYPYAKQVNWSTRTRIRNDSGDYLQVSYSKFVRVREDNSIISDTQTENISPGLGLTTKYLNLFGEVNYVNFELRQWRYSVVLKPPGNCIQLMLSSVFVPNGDAQYFVNANFNFGGDI
jgi:LPS-assembly protein